MLLAAGFSTRLGTPKALARIRGEPLLRRTLRLLLPLGAWQILIVVPPRSNRYRAASIRSGFSARIAGRFRVGRTHNFIDNPRRASGLATSVQRGLRRSWCASAVLFIPVDLARLAARDLARLVARWRGNRRRVVARRIGRCGGIPLILPRWLYAQALEISGDAGLKDLIRTIPDDGTRLISLPSAAWDVDTTADLESARRPRAPRGTFNRSTRNS